MRSMVPWQSVKARPTVPEAVREPEVAVMVYVVMAEGPAALPIITQPEESVSPVGSSGELWQEVMPKRVGWRLTALKRA